MVDVSISLDIAVRVATAQIDARIAARKVGSGIGVVPTSLANDDLNLLRCLPPLEGTSASS